MTRFPTRTSAVTGPVRTGRRQRRVRAGSASAVTSRAPIRSSPSPPQASATFRGILAVPINRPSRIDRTVTAARAGSTRNEPQMSGLPVHSPAAFQGGVPVEEQRGGVVEEALRSAGVQTTAGPDEPLGRTAVDGAGRRRLGAPSGPSASMPRLVESQTVPPVSETELTVSSRGNAYSKIAPGAPNRKSALVIAPFPTGIREPTTHAPSWPAVAKSMAVTPNCVGLLQVPAAERSWIWPVRFQAKTWPSVNDTKPPSSGLAIRTSGASSRPS